ncbi:P-loop containing nucleoside triphosphate hydrolase [Sesbania bispinosa]|nr:P-loop containing nucleoside triphosphate hydrolase [Sesbania bispinosa]
MNDAIIENYLMEETEVQPRQGRRYQGEEQCNGDSKPELKPKDKDKEDDDSHAFTMNASHYEPLSIENDNVWSLIPELRLDMLRKITSGFIDVYESGNSEKIPGLQIYTLVMNLTDVQNELFQKLQKKMVGSSVFLLEGQLMELNQLEKFKSDFKVGSKVRFILSLIIRVVKEEKGREILLLYGEQDLFERGKVIDKFEDPCGVSKVLLASITAYAEGISLTAASRLIILDSEWNPSKIKHAIARDFRPGQENMVYVYQLLAKGSMEEDKYRRTIWKEWISNMIFSEDFLENPSQWQAEKIEDDILREMVENDNPKAIHMIMKNEKASTN